MSDPSTETAAETGSATTTDASQAASSTAETEGVKSLLDTVSTALGETENSPPSEKPGEDARKQTPTGEAEKPTGPTDPTDDELKQYSPNAQTRIRELVQRRKDAESGLETVRQELEQHKPKAEQFDRLTTFMQQNQIEPQELNNTMAITAMVKSGRYEEALQAVAPIYQELLKRTGNILPDDLRQDVEAGYITTQRALELQRARMSTETARERERQEAQRREADDNRRTVQERTRIYGESATAWENAKKASDPDWSTKQKLVSDLTEAELLRIRNSDPSKLPTDAKGVVALLDKVLAQVEDQLKVFRPKPAPKDHETGRPASAGAKSKPTSYMDAVNQALGE